MNCPYCKRANESHRSVCYYCRCDLPTEPEPSREETLRSSDWVAALEGALQQAEKAGESVMMRSDPVSRETSLAIHHLKLALEYERSRSATEKLWTKTL
jgi:hypothetical protein